MINIHHDKYHSAQPTSQINPTQPAIRQDDGPTGQPTQRSEKEIMQGKNHAGKESCRKHLRTWPSRAAVLRSFSNPSRASWLFRRNAHSSRPQQQWRSARLVEEWVGMCPSAWLGIGVDSIAAALSLLGGLSVQSWVLHKQKCRRSELAVAPPFVER
jgi:hypothetical protein